MLIEFIEIRNFRKLKSCRIDFSDQKTVFVGANNCGKTSAMDALITFLKVPDNLQTRDITLSNWTELNKIGTEWIESDAQNELSILKWADLLPQLDVWLNVPADETYHVAQLIPTLDWPGGRLGVRFRFQPKDIEKLYSDFKVAYKAAQTVIEKSKSEQKPISIKLWPKTLADFLEKRLHSHFAISPYLLDVARIEDVDADGIARPQQLVPEALPLEKDPFKGLIRIDVINAQRGFSDASSYSEEKIHSAGSLTSQLKSYYGKHLDPSEHPELKDLEALQAIDDAQRSFDEKLSISFQSSINELEKLNYPGFGGNPKIRLSTKLNAIDGLNHKASIQFSLLTSGNLSADEFAPTLPEKYNGLGYQNLISMVFRLISFRDAWMQVGKKSRVDTTATNEPEFEPLHLVLIEEPEAYLHAQVQQVFIRKAYELLRAHNSLKGDSFFKTQLIVSTHSSHIAHEIDFTSLRYFKRIAPREGCVATSTVVNLSTTFGTQTDSKRFAIRYIKTTHCDLFFADAVIIVEGAVERMLIPRFIESSYKELSSCYIALLEIGGRHANKLQPLLENLGIVTLIVTDLDSMNPGDKNKKVIPEKGKGYHSGNTTLSAWLPGKTLLDELMAPELSKVCGNHPIRIAYQCPITTRMKNDVIDVEIIPYTFEIALAFKNVKLFKSLDGGGMIGSFRKAAKEKLAKDANEKFYKALKGKKKAEFALDLLFQKDPAALEVPEYIAEGLEWLCDKLKPETL